MPGYRSSALAALAALGCGGASVTSYGADDTTAGADSRDTFIYGATNVVTVTTPAGSVSK
jgi:hypothetical protein